MNNFDNKIKKIKTTIDDIRLDIDSMKIKNEKSMAKMLTSISNLSRNNSNANSILPSSRSFQENNSKCEYKNTFENQIDYTNFNTNKLANNTILTNFTNSQLEQPNIKQTDLINYTCNSNFNIENNDINLSRNIINKESSKNKINKPSIPFIPQPLKYTKYSTPKAYTTPSREPAKYQEIISESPKYNFDYTYSEKPIIKESAKKTLNVYKEVEDYSQQNIPHREHNHLRFNTDYDQKINKNESVFNYSKTNLQHSNFKEQKSIMEEYLPEKENKLMSKYNTITFEQEKINIENSMQNSSKAYLSSQNSTYGNVNYELIIQELTSLLGNNVTPSELPLVFKEYLHTFKQYKLRDEFIEKLSNLYASFYGETATKIDIKVMWRWIKDLIHFRKHNGYADDDSIYYKSFCEDMIREYELKDLNGLKQFLNSLITKNIKNSKRVDRIKKLLFSDTPKETEF